MPWLTLSTLLLCPYISLFFLYLRRKHLELKDSSSIVWREQLTQKIMPSARVSDFELMFDKAEAYINESYLAL